LTDKVISYQQGIVSYESISGYISLYVYDYPRRTKHWDQDRCSDFFVFVHHRLKKMADSFVFSGLPFEAYLNVSLKHQMNSFLKKRREKELKEEVFCRMCAAGSLEDESSLYKIRDDFNYEIKEPVAVYKRKTGLGRTKQRLFFLALSDPDRLDDDSIAQISASTGYSIDYINRCCMAVKEKVLQKREELRRLREKKSGWFFQLLVIQDKIMNEPDPDKRLWLEERMQRLRDRIERISKKIAAKASCLVTHQDLAQVLGVSKGTVDSSIFYLKRKRETHQVSSSSEDIQSLHSLQR